MAQFWIVDMPSPKKMFSWFVWAPSALAFWIASVKNLTVPAAPAVMPSAPSIVLVLTIAAVMPFMPSVCCFICEVMPENEDATAELA
nr:hypothetical protein [Gordonia sp. NB41Y]